MQQRLKRCLGIDIGTSSVKIADMSTERGGVRVHHLMRGDLSPGPMDAARIQEIGKLVRDLLAKNKISTKKAVLSLPGQTVFIRRLRIPKTNEERLHRVVAYEARQQIPFALENSLMEYQVFDHGASGEVEVLLVAIKTDLVNDFMKIVNRLGIQPVMVSVTSLALFNFQVFDSTPFSELQEAIRASAQADSSPAPAARGPKKKGMAMPKLSFGKKKKLDMSDVANAAPPEAADATLEIEDFPIMDDALEQVQAYINIGAATFDLAIGRHGRRKMLGFTRSVPWAGNELTRQLTNKAGVDPAEAEGLKVSQARIPQPGEADTGVNPQITNVTTSWADRLVLEIRKSFDFYIAQPDGMAVDTMVLTGGQSNLPGLDRYIEDKLGVPVEVQNSPRNEALMLGSAYEGQSIGSYLIALGNGLTGLGMGQVTVDFLPTDLKTIREFKKKNVELAVMGAALLALIGLSTQMGQQEIQNMQGWLRDNNDKLTQAATDQARVSQARSARQTVSEQITALGQALGDRAFWLDFLAMLESVKPSGVVISNLELQPNGTVLLHGETASPQAQQDLLNGLELQKDWIAKAELVGSDNRGSQLQVGRPATRFIYQLDTHWKKSRLEPARVTLTPGHWTPTPSPTAGAGFMGGMGMGMDIPI